MPEAAAQKAATARLRCDAEGDLVGQSHAGQQRRSPGARSRCSRRSAGSPCRPVPGESRPSSGASSPATRAASSTCRRRRARGAPAAGWRRGGRRRAGSRRGPGPTEVERGPVGGVGRAPGWQGAGRRRARRAAAPAGARRSASSSTRSAAPRATSDRASWCRAARRRRIDETCGRAASWGGRRG